MIEKMMGGEPDVSRLAVIRVYQVDVPQQDPVHGSAVLPAQWDRMALRADWLVDRLSSREWSLWPAQFLSNQGLSIRDQIATANTMLLRVPPPGRSCPDTEEE